MKNKYTFLFLILLFISCDFEKKHQSFLNDELGLNIKVVNNGYWSMEKSPKEEMEFKMDDFVILNNEKKLYKKDYPKWNYMTKGWVYKKWKSSLSFKKDTRLDIVRDYKYKVVDEGKVKNMMDALSKKGNIYTYSYKEDESEITDIQMFVVDVDNLKFYTYEIYSHAKD